jgi:acyl-CoA synthetase (AMP-forming)/AMP-acid ligase II
MFDKLTVDSIAARAVLVPMPRPLRRPRSRVRLGQYRCTTAGFREIGVRGHTVMKGYWNLAASGADAVVDEWFSTGDIGRVDEDGYFFLVARENI